MVIIIIAIYYVIYFALIPVMTYVYGCQEAAFEKWPKRYPQGNPPNIWFLGFWDENYVNVIVLYALWVVPPAGLFVTLCLIILFGLVEFMRFCYRMGHRYGCPPSRKVT